MSDYDELLKKYALKDSNYKKWRKEHTKMFGEIFSEAFKDNLEAQIHLTAALINISGRNFDAAFPKLNILEDVSISKYDRTVVNYFLGLNYELCGNEERMNYYYERLREQEVDFIFPLAFHPYYRTAKFAQRDSECSKSVYYYRKALSFYDGRTFDDKVSASASQIIYDIATVYLYMHEYEECERFLSRSEEINPLDNQQRNYVKAILFAVQNGFSESYSLAERMNRFFREYLDPMLDAIKENRDLHYCICDQDRSGYEEFWNWLTLNKEKLENLLASNIEEASRLISEKLTSTLSFMKRKLDCRIEHNEENATLYLKNYSVKTLMSEYEALISLKPKSFCDWNFVSVNWFENYT